MLSNCFGAALALGFLIIGSSLAEAAETGVPMTKFPPIAPRIRSVLEKVVADHAARPLDNITGGIAWGASYEMDALLEMYRATDDPWYLEKFTVLADKVVAARADKQGQRDWKGALRRGWLTGAHYTLGLPYPLLDTHGKPVLEIQTVANAGNNSTTITVTPAADGKTFTLTVTNDFRKSPLTKTFSGLTPENVEAQVNSPGDASRYVSVRRLRNGIPRAYASFTPPVGNVVLHGHHTGKIIAPLAQFASLVKREPKLTRFSPQATSYLTCAEEAIADMNGDWREAGDYGYFVFEKGIPFWSDGVPEPLNVLASTGTAYLNLFDATGKPLYRERAEKLARLIRREFIAQPDGTFLYYYWWGIVHTGWKPEDKISVNTPRYAGAKHAEDTSHLQLSLRFIAECYERKIVFSREDLQRWAATFHKQLYKAAPDGGTMADNVAGAHVKAAGTYDGSIAGSALLGIIDPTVPDACRTLFEAKLTPSSSRSVTLYGWSVLARIEAQRKSSQRL
ncbi:MAG: hypothetical protein V4671_07820 [Armatimonadota bacterium]